MSLIEPTVRRSVALLLIGALGIWIGLSGSAPIWLMLVLAWSHGGLAMITIADYLEAYRRTAARTRFTRR
jgi:hypothetical protein